MQLIDIHAILKPIVEVQGVVTIDSSSDDGNGVYTINTTDTSYTRPPKSITTVEGDYKIQSFVQNQSLTVTGPALPTGDINLVTPKYWHGTVMQTASERVNIPNKAEETPFVYFAETYTEDYGDIATGFVDIPLRLFFLDESDFNNYETNDYYDDVIKPMRAMCEGFINRLYTTKGILNIDDIRITNHTRFATFVDSNGYEKNLFSETLSGVELRCTVRLKQKRC